MQIIAEGDKNHNETKKMKSFVLIPLKVIQSSAYENSNNTQRYDYNINYASKGIHRLSTITEDIEKNGITIKNRSQPCGLTNSRNWETWYHNPQKILKELEHMKFLTPRI